DVDLGYCGRAGAPVCRQPRRARHPALPGAAAAVRGARSARPDCRGIMRQNTVKRRLRAGEVCVGTIIFEFNTSGIARIAAAAGADFLFYDQEHSGWTTDVLRMLVALIETVTGLENVEKIAAVPGIDVLWLGHFDLTASMGIPAQFTHPRYLAAVERIAAAAAAARKPAGFMAGSVDEAAVMLKKGYRCVAYWGDLWIYGQGLKNGIDGTRKAAAALASGAARG